MKNDLTQGSVADWLIKLTSPMVLGILSIFLFNLVDTYFISMLGTEPLAAISFTFPATMMVMNIAIGLSIATGAVVSKAIGQKNQEQTRNWVSSSFYLSIALGLVISLIGYISQEWVFGKMGAEASLIPLIREYMDTWYLGCVFLIVMIAVNACIRATGNTKLPSLIMLLSAVLNGILDPLLIFGIGPFPEMGMQGAAIATIISWGVAFIVIIRTLINMGLLRFSFPDNFIVTSQSLIKLGIPASLTNMLGAASKWYYRRLGRHIRYACRSRLWSGQPIRAFSVDCHNGINRQLAPVCWAKLWGLKKFDRIEEALKKSIFFVIVWQFIVYVALVLLAKPISQIFSDDLDVQTIIQTFLYILPISYIGLGICLVSTSTINALHLPKYSLLITLLRLFALYIPMAWGGHLYFGLSGIFWGCAIANILIGGYVAWVFYRVKNSPELLNRFIVHA